MIFVTGGTGLVGAHVLLKLSLKNIPFVALKRESSKLDVCKKIFLKYNASKYFNNIKWINGDVTDVISLDEGMHECEYVIHCAGLVSFQDYDQELLYRINTLGTENVVNIALSKDIKKLIYISSIAALGRNSTSQIVTEDNYFQHSNVENHYSISKYYAEQEVWRASAEGLDVVILNPSVILGPGDWSRGSSQLFQKIYKGLPFYTNGATGYVDVLDVSSAALQLLFSPLKNERYILNGINISYKKAFALIAKKFNKKEATILVTPFIKELAWRLEKIRSFFTRKPPMITRQTANTSMRISSYSNEKIKKDLGFQFIDFKTTINNYCKWFIDDLNQTSL